VRRSTGNAGSDRISEIWELGGFLIGLQMFQAK
jgi:hypothetical protein